ncbi:MAG TPA: radical SAM-associated putative lipoprotein [Bacteroidales bacterium]|nr:radical SAM-associated putative lipoprotein [Bacteroidales bacterium]
MKLPKIKSSIYKKVLGMFGAAGFLITFQACYGTPQNYANIEGTISDNDTQQGIEGLKVNIVSDSDSLSTVTDSSGNFYTGIITNDRNLKITVEDIDGEENGTYNTFNTSVDYKNELITISLNENI